MPSRSSDRAGSGSLGAWAIRSRSMLGLVERHVGVDAIAAGQHELRLDRQRIAHSLDRELVMDRAVLGVDDKHSFGSWARSTRLRPVARGPAIPAIRARRSPGAFRRPIPGSGNAPKRSFEVVEQERPDLAADGVDVAHRRPRYRGVFQSLDDPGAVALELEPGPVARSRRATRPLVGLQRHQPSRRDHRTADLPGAATLVSQQRADGHVESSQPADFTGGRLEPLPCCLRRWTHTARRRSESACRTAARQRRPPLEVMRRVQRMSPLPRSRATT